jgi:hypothetical protein
VARLVFHFGGGSRRRYKVARAAGGETVEGICSSCVCDPLAMVHAMGSFVDAFRWAVVGRGFFGLPGGAKSCRGDGRRPVRAIRGSSVGVGDADRRYMPLSAELHASHFFCLSGAFTDASNGTGIIMASRARLSCVRFVGVAIEMCWPCLQSGRFRIRTFPSTAFPSNSPMIARSAP